VKLLSPFAPHLADELWTLLGHADSLANAPWPEYDPAKITVDEIEIVFQVNGKVRGRAKAAPDADEESLKALALADASVQRTLQDQTPKKIIVVKNKLVNIVV
jgi:leucyl-tRNA synthetase